MADEPPLHPHCLHCVNRRCMVRPEPGVACDLVGCPAVCGAVFHSCKLSEHRLLCPYERLACINAGFGCPFTITRSKMAAHLQVCPASIVCCTMEWNRWPVSYADRKSYESLSRDLQQVEQLDMALALQDQRMLLESLRATSVSQKDAQGAAGATEKDEPYDVYNTSVQTSDFYNPSVQTSDIYNTSVQTSRSLAAALDILTSSKDIEVIVSDVGKDSAAQRKDSGAQRNTNTWHSDTGHSDTGPSDTGPSETGPSETGPSDTGPSDTRPSDTQPSDTRPSNTGPSDSELGAVGGVASGAQRQWALTDALFHEKPLSNDVLHKHSPVVASGPPRLPRHALVPQPPRAAHVTRVPPPVPPPVPLPPLPHVPLPPPPHVPLPQLPRPPLPQLPRPPLPQLPRVPLPHPPHVPLPVPVPFLISDQLARNQFLQHLPSELRFRYLEQKLQSADILRGMFSFSSRRALLAEPYLFRAKMEDKAVDTSDLEVAEDPMGLHGIDLITAALLFCLGDSPGGRGISDSRFVDGYHMDFGTQTFSFPSAILATDTMVGDMSSASACDHASPQLCNPSPFHTLRLDLMLECVARYQTRQRSMFTFVCGQLFRRDEFSSHFRNVHGDIHAGLSGWMEQRCPLAYYGCTFSQRRFCPQAQGARIIHDPHLGAFGLRPGGRGSEGARRPRPSDQLSSLPFEVLQHVARFLDSFSLCQLSRVSRTMREVCGSLLQLRGMVVLLWERRRREDGALSWAITDKVWRFSTAFGTVSEWKFANISSMADHLKKCRFNTVSRREEAVPLPCMCFTRELTREGRSLRAVLKPVA